MKWVKETRAGGRVEGRVVHPESERTQKVSKDSDKVSNQQKGEGG